jgi:hypothetical protein
MKRIIAAVSFAALAVPAFAFAAEVWAPLEKSQFDRTLPNLQNSVVTQRASAGSTSAPSGMLATGVWANDPNFIAPAR